MPDLQLHWTAEELLASHDVVEPLVADGVRCHGGRDADGVYRSPRTRHRTTAIETWRRAHRERGGGEVLEAPLDLWPEVYPSLEQSRYLLSEGVREPIVTTLTRIGTVEGFGSMIRHVGPDDLQPWLDDSIDGTCVQHLHRGLFEAHARDEAGWRDEAGHDRMWFAARDIAFEHPVTEDETRTMLERMGITPPGGGPVDLGAVREAARARQAFPDLDLDVEILLRRMISLLFIEVSAFHTFAWAEALLSERELVAGEGEAARLVACIRADETPHVDYLLTALTELRDRTFVAESGARLPGRTVIGTLWDQHLDESLGARREAAVRTARAEIEHALSGRRRRDEILEGFDALDSRSAGTGGAGEEVSSR